MNTQGLIVKSYKSGKNDENPFLGCTVSPRGEFIYCLGEDSNIYCFSVSTGKLVYLLQAHHTAVIGLKHHPHQNMLAVWTSDGFLKTWIAPAIQETHENS